MRGYLTSPFKMDEPVHHICMHIRISNVVLNIIRLHIKISSTALNIVPCVLYLILRLTCCHFQKKRARQINIPLTS
jgi:hypothetical protein